MSMIIKMDVHCLLTDRQHTIEYYFYCDEKYQNSYM